MCECLKCMLNGNECAVHRIKFHFTTVGIIINEKTYENVQNTI